MTGNTFGRIFRVTTSGESYGEALLTIVDGVPPGLKLTNEMIQEELDKRKPGQSKLDSPRKETDIVNIVSGILDGFSTGAPIGMVVYNVDRHDIHVQQYRDVKEQIRPGHAEYTFLLNTANMQIGAVQDEPAAAKALAELLAEPLLNKYF